MVPSPRLIRPLLRCSRLSTTISLSSRGSRINIAFPKCTSSSFSTTHAMAAFERLIRFQTSDGRTVYGDLEKETPTRKIEGSSVEILEGDVKKGFQKTGTKATVSKLLSPLPTTNIILCVGLNYRQHAEECSVGRPVSYLHQRPDKFVNRCKL